MLHVFVPSLSVLLAASAFVFGGSGEPASGAGSTAAVNSTARAKTSNLDAALDAIRMQSIRADIDYLACDEMGGRDTPSAGQRLAARYLRSRLTRLGWQPAAPGGFFYPYWLDYKAVDDVQTTLTLKGGREVLNLKFGEDYFFQSGSMTNDSFKGGVVFGGVGSQEDLADADVEGHWLLCWDEPGTSWRRRQRNADRAGALGVIAMPGPNYDGDAYSVRYESWASAAKSPRPSWPSGRKKEIFPYVYLQSDAALQLFERHAATSGAASLADWKIGTQVATECVDQRATQGDGGQVQLENVAAIWPGSDPELTSEVIILSAHYDHVGTNSKGEIFNGADDNGSGTTGLLGVAEALAAHGPLRRTVMLMWVSAEEKGLLGSKAWARYPWMPAGYRPICDINIDMIGRNAADYLLITPTSDHEAYNQLTQLAERMAPQEGFAEMGSADQYWMRSDQAMFSINLEMPVCFLFSDVHEDYHKPTDTPEKINIDKIQRVARMVVRMVAALQDDKLELDEAPVGVWHTAVARGDVLRLTKACQKFASDEGALPMNLEELVQAEHNYLFGLEAVPQDPWGRDYKFVRGSGASAELVIASHGRDGVADDGESGEGEDQDILSTDLL